MSFEKLKICGGRPVKGEFSAQGAKNSSLPLLAASLLADGESVLYNCPYLTDCETASEILKHLGCRIKREKNTIMITPGNGECCDIPEDLMLKMRSSIVFLGAILAKCGKARLSYPGGCELGPRPIDLHISSLRQLGVIIEEKSGFLECSVPNGLVGTDISLGFPSVGATENIILAACLAKGETFIINAAQEPEIIDLANFLNKCGANIKGAGESKIVISGVEKLRATPHRVMADRIAVATYLCMAAGTRGAIKINNISPGDLSSLLPVLKGMGCDIIVSPNSIYINAQSRRLEGIKIIKTLPYPGFPTDAQPPLMAVTTTANGSSIFIENIFENRYKHVNDLIRMGADIKVEGRAAFVTGVNSLYGMQVEACDLRGGASIITAGLMAKGETVVSNIHHVDRGYENIEILLSALGADIERISN